MSALVHQHANFEQNSFLNGQPVKFAENRGDVIKLSCPCYESGSNILNTLESLEQSFADSIEKAIAVT